MKLLKIFFTLTLFMAITAIALSATPNFDDSNTNSDESEATDPPPADGKEATSHRGQPGSDMTCDKYPRVCRVVGSPGRDCCKKKCVNVSKDKLNCGKCGKKCKYPEICCKGQCVNPMSHNKHCGGCSKPCKKGSKCLYGMCSYA